MAAHADATRPARKWGSRRAPAHRHDGRVVQLVDEHFLGAFGVTVPRLTCRIVAVTFPSPIDPTRMEGPHLGILYSHRPGVLFWEPGPLHMPLPDQYTIVKEYRGRCDQLWKDWRRAELAFGRDFPPSHAEPQPSAAWIGPDGSFYPCRWMEHDRLAYRLASLHYNDPGGPRTLERRGWIRIQHDGVIIRPSLGMSLAQPQLDTLFTLLQRSEGLYRANIREELDLSAQTEQLRPPPECPTGAGNG